MPNILYRIPGWAWFVAGLAGTIALSSLVRAQVVAPLWAFPVLAVWLAVCMSVSWIRLDEPAREAHKFAWWWGGSTGLLVVVVGCIALPFVNGASDHLATTLQGLKRSGPAESAAFVAGVEVAALVAVVGYALAWAGWWMGKR